MTDKPFDPTKPVVVFQPEPTDGGNASNAGNGGPSTITGKAISSKNATRHGCCANETLLLPTESAEDLKALETIWLKSYNPNSEAERHLVAELVQADWFLQRSTRAYQTVESDLYTTTPSPTDWTEQQERKLGRFLRYKTTHTNNVHKCKKAIEDYRKARLSEKTTAEKLVIAQERVKALKQRNNPEPTWKEHLEGMRQKAISMGYTPPNPMQR